LVIVFRILGLLLSGELRAAAIDAAFLAGGISQVRRYGLPLFP
jgi:hypothetical protein